MVHDIARTLIDDIHVSSLPQTYPTAQFIHLFEIDIDQQDNLPILTILPYRYAFAHGNDPFIWACVHVLNMR
ncbi:hypothetical protein D3C76_1217960 [compost metagenome]